MNRDQNQNQNQRQTDQRERKNRTPAQLQPVTQSMNEQHMKLSYRIYENGAEKKIKKTEKEENRKRIAINFERESFNQ